MDKDREQELFRIMASATSEKNGDDSKSSGSVMVVSSDGVVAINGNNTGDINLNVTRTTRTEFTPSEQHITPATALKIKDLVGLPPFNKSRPPRVLEFPLGL